MKRKSIRILFITGCILLPLIAMSLSLMIGRFPVAFKDIFLSIGESLHLSTEQVPAEIYTVVIHLRIPRTIAAAFVGAGLAASGVAYQGVFRNPLVNSGLLGVSNGAAFGAALAIVLFGSYIGTNLFAFIFGMVAVGLSYWIARIYKTVPTIMLILGGTIVSSIFSALLTILKSVADTENELPAIVYWMMGSVSSTSYEDFWALIPIILGIIILLLYSYQINVISMGEKQAQTMGIHVKSSKKMIIIAATLSTAGAVCLSGVVGWVGLVIPHIGRMLIGNDNRKLIPVSLSIGASFMVLIDTVSRSVTSSEIPLGVLTALIGAPFFIFLLKKTKGGGWN